MVWSTRWRYSRRGAFLSVVNTWETDGLGELVFPLWLRIGVSRYSLGSKLES